MISIPSLPTWGSGIGVRAIADQDFLHLGLNRREKTTMKTLG